MKLLGGLLAVLLLAAGCASNEPDDADGVGAALPGASASSPSASQPDPTVSAAPSPPPETTSVDARPKPGACYDLSFQQALEPVTAKRSRDCDKPHTTRTVFVGKVSGLVDGTAPIDSAAVQRAVAKECPARVSSFLGGPEQASRLSLFRPVWFTPSLEQESVGQRWYRCDVIALAAEGRLARLDGRLEGRLGRSGWQDSYGLCGTAEPGTRGFERVACARSHSWRAISTVGFSVDRYPGEAAVRSRGQSPCTDAARDRAVDPLDFRWGYEWPTQEQWRAGIRYGVCWTPSD